MARILILEDESTLANAWQTALTRAGHTVLLTESYEKFEEVFQREIIDLMIIDLSLSNDGGNPRFSGLVALSDNLLRSNLRGSKVPYIVVSGYLSSDEQDPLRQRVEPFKPDAVLAKPFDLATLLGKVSELLR